MQAVGRSLFIQSAWNYENFQGVGFGYALVPLMKETASQDAPDPDLAARHLKSFNTNPYMVGMILGGVLRLEERLASGQGSVEDVENFKSSLMGAFGALGDSFVWGGLRPLLGLLAVMLAVLSGAVAPLVFLVCYNGIVLWLRIAGVRNGYAYGAELIQYLKTINLQRKIYRMNGLTLFMIGALLPLWALQVRPEVPVFFAGLLALLVMVIYLLWKAERKGVPMLLQAAALLLVAQLLAQTGWFSF